VQEKNSRWIVGITGASGIRYGLRLIRVLSQSVVGAPAEVHVVFSDSALRVLNEEENLKISASGLSSATLFGEEFGNLHFHNFRDIGAEIASGSALFKGMVIVPCSMATLGAIANGVPQNLIHRAAEVTMKEGRRLILVPRETPLSAIHLENMLKLSRLGVTMLPAMPGFYSEASTISDLVDMLVMKILDQMGLPNNLCTRWNGRSPVANRQERRSVGFFKSCEGH
jgi:4-hydroxy-3-polyprenylbenzoate decarboxylase